MRFLAGYVMRGRMQAIVVVAVSAMLSLLLPPLTYISGAAVGLVTLRQGLMQGLIVIAGTAIAVGVLGKLAIDTPFLALVLLLALWLPVALLGHALRRTVRLEVAIWLAAAFGWLVVVGSYLLLGDPQSWWLNILQAFLAEAGDEVADGEQLAVMTAELAGLMSGLLAAAFSLSLIGCLLLARWWQALLYNVGGFRREFHSLRLGRAASLAVVLLLALAAWASDTAALLARDLMMPVLLVFVLQGLAVVHGLVAVSRVQGGWLVVLYLLLLFAMPKTGLVLAIAGWVDNWFDFRAFFAKGRTK